MGEDWYEFFEKNKDNVYIRFKRIIDDKTLREYRSIESNIYCDPFMITKETNSRHFTKKEFRVIITRIKKITGKRVKLVETDNKYAHTRLIYGLR